MGAAGSLPDRQRLRSVTYADDARKLGMEDDRKSGPGEQYVLTCVPMIQPTKPVARAQPRRRELVLMPQSGRSPFSLKRCRTPREAGVRSEGRRCLRSPAPDIIVQD